MLITITRIVNTFGYKIDIVSDWKFLIVNFLLDPVFSINVMCLD